MTTLCQPAFLINRVHKPYTGEMADSENLVIGTIVLCTRETRQMFPLSATNYIWGRGEVVYITQCGDSGMYM